MIIRSIGLVIACSLSVGSFARAEVVILNESERLATWHVDGLWDLEGLGSWNGSPVSSTNMPSDGVRQLSADVSMYAVQGNSSQLFMRVHNVITTQGANWFGSDGFLGDHALTSVQVTLRSGSGVNLLPSTISAEYAQEGQALLYGTSSSTAHADPLANTVGWTSAIGVAGFGVNCAAFPANAMVSYGLYWGPTSRIRGGGVFLIDFGGVPLIDIDWNLSSASVGFGNQSQVFGGVLVPAPGVFIPLLGGFGFHRRRRSR